VYIKPLILGCVMLSSCSAHATTGCSDTIDSVVLEKLDMTFGTTQKRIDEVRVWAKSLSDRCIRESYLYWLKSFERDLRQKEAKDALRPNIPSPPGGVKD